MNCMHCDLYASLCCAVLCCAAAGMMYLTNMEQASAESPLRSPQGYDQVSNDRDVGGDHHVLEKLN